MTNEEEREYLRKISPDALPLDTSESGYTAEEIRQHFTQPLYFLLDIFQELKEIKIEDKDEIYERMDEVESGINKILSGETAAKKAEADETGAPFGDKYETKVGSNNKYNTVLDYVDENFVLNTKNISVISDTDDIGDITEELEGRLYLLFNSQDLKLLTINNEEVETIYDYNNIISSLSSMPALIDTKVNAEKTLRETAIAEVNERINNIARIGRYLSLWNAETGEPLTQPPLDNYVCNAGDYFIINNLPDEGEDILLPVGGTFTNRVVPTEAYDGEEEIIKGDFYIYDGEGNWSIKHVSTAAFSFSDLVGDPLDNYAMETLMNQYQEKLTTAQLAKIETVSSKSTVSLSADGKKLTIDGVEKNIYTPNLTPYRTASEQDEIDDLLATKQEVNNSLISYRTADEQDEIDDLKATKAQLNSYRTSANQDIIDNTLSGRISAIESHTDVVDVVGTYNNLLAYDTSTLLDKDIVKVLSDSSHSGAISYYRWLANTSTWQFVGSQGPYYTIDEVDEIVQDNTLVAGDNITIENGVISAAGEAINYATTQDIDNLFN